MVGVTDRSPLAQLVDEVCAANGWSRREVARRARAHGRSLSSSRLGQLLAEYPLRGIQADKIDDIAIGLGISRDRVALVVVQAMGFRITDQSVTPAEAIRRDPGLSQHTKDALLAILRAASPAPTRSGGGEHEHRSAPIATSRPGSDPDPRSSYAGQAHGDTEALRARLRQHLEGESSDERRAELTRLLNELDQAEEAARAAADSSATESA